MKMVLRQLACLPRLRLLFSLLPLLAASRVPAQCQDYINASMIYNQAQGYLILYCTLYDAAWIDYGPTTNYGNTFQPNFNYSYGGYPAFANFIEPAIYGDNFVAELWHYRAAIAFGRTNYTADATFVTGGSPSFIVQPQSQTVTVGGSASFTATVLNANAVTFQWITNGVPIPGATGIAGIGQTASASYTFTNVQPSENGLGVSVTASNNFSPIFPVSSTNAVLTVSQPPPPLLLGTLRGSNFVLSWPASANGFTLQTRASVGPTSWVNVPGTPLTNSATVSLAQPTSFGAQFFRLAGSQ
jgi:hypothetical protein